MHPADYRPKVGATDQKSELQPGRPQESEPNRPEKEPESGFGASTENPLKAFLNPPHACIVKTFVPRGRVFVGSPLQQCGYLWREEIPETGYVSLAAQCKISPHIAQHPFEIVSQRGYRTRFALFS